MIKSNNFNVDKNGNMTCSNATMNNVTIKGNNMVYEPANEEYQSFKILNPIMKNISNTMSWYTNVINEGGTNKVTLYAEDDYDNCFITVENAINQTNIYPHAIDTPIINQTSRESVKKNIEEYKENALEIVNNSKIYDYNFKFEKDTDKKHKGFVIGDLGGNYATPEQVISKNGQGIDTYTMTSILWKAVQELNEKVEKQDKLIKLLLEKLNIREEDTNA